MSTIVLRNTKGTPLTFTEMDNNFNNLNTDKAEKYNAGITNTVYAGPYTFTHTTPASGRHEFLAVPTGGWENHRHTLQVQFDFSTAAYFSLVDASGGNHFACVLHQDPALVASAVRGNGVIFGSCDNGVGEKTPYRYPTTMIESWFNGTAAINQNRLFPGSEGVPEFKLRDGQTYRVKVQSTTGPYDEKYVRYAIWRKNTTVHPEGAWDLERDTGHYLDFNAWADFTKTGVFFGQVFSPGSGWTITLSNINISWGPPIDITAADRIHRRENAYLGIFPTFTDPTGATNLGNAVFNMTGFDHSEIQSFAANAWDWNNVLPPFKLRDLMVSLGMSTTNATAVETVVGRPMYAMVAKILYHMKNRGW